MHVQPFAVSFPAKLFLCLDGPLVFRSTVLRIPLVGAGGFKPAGRCPSTREKAQLHHGL